VPERNSVESLAWIAEAPLLDRIARLTAENDRLRRSHAELLDAVRHALAETPMLADARPWLVEAVDRAEKGGS
jgi:hypothetical protein